jgi:Uma2 family endonuclease
MVTTRLMTAGDLATLPNDGYQYELVRGELRRMPTPGWEHGRYCARIARPLFAYEDETGPVTVVTNDTGFWLERNPDTVRGPDIAVVLNERLPSAFHGTYQTVPPTLAVEVKSPSDRLPDIEDKIEDYRRAGVSLIWYIFTETKTVWVDGAGRQRVILTEADVLDGSDVLPGLPPIPVADIFR